jgi:hypothetical protein
LEETFEEEDISTATRIYFKAYIKNKQTPFILDPNPLKIIPPPSQLLNTKS